jgi:hypothetical protein
MVDSVVGLVQHHWSTSRRYGFQYAIQSEVAAWHQGKLCRFPLPDMRANHMLQVYRSIRIPSYIAYTTILATGIVLQYLWAAGHPDYRIKAVVQQPEARDDNYLVLLGLCLFVETSNLLQWALANPLFVYLGRRSLSEYHLRFTLYTTNADTGFFFVQSIVIYTLGIKLYQALHLANDNAAIAVCFFVTLAASAAGAELFYRLIDIPSHILSHVAFDWIRE